MAFVKKILFYYFRSLIFFFAAYRTFEVFFPYNMTQNFALPSQSGLCLSVLLAFFLSSLPSFLLSAVDGRNCSVFKDFV